LREIEVQEWFNYTDKVSTVELVVFMKQIEEVEGTEKTLDRYDLGVSCGKFNFFRHNTSSGDIIFKENVADRQ